MHFYQVIKKPEQEVPVFFMISCHGEDYFYGHIEAAILQ